MTSQTPQKPAQPGLCGKAMHPEPQTRTGSGALPSALQPHMLAAYCAGHLAATSAQVFVALPWDIADPRAERWRDGFMAAHFDNRERGINEGSFT